MEESCQPFYFEQSKDIAVLLVHGFTGSPGEMKPLGEYLATKNITAYGILLPGHCTSPEDMATKKWTMWASAVEDGFQKLKNDGYKNIFVCGLSMGGALTLYFAENHNDFSGMISLAAPVEIRDPRLKLIPIYKFFKPFIPKEEAQKGPEIKYELYHFSYDVIPVRALHELLKLLKAVKKNLSRITVPALIVHGKLDETVPTYNAEVIYNSISSQHKELLWLEKSHHVMTLDVERAKLFEAVENFVRKHAK
ncbi:MAG: esterase [Candidatus Asgardarchaeum californiense]|nr:MAG: esterase [Candidatus Asgardarchaeum californiense]